MSFWANQTGMTMGYRLGSPMGCCRKKVSKSLEMHLLLASKIMKSDDPMFGSM